MGLSCCDMCWDRPCTCGHEARAKEQFRAQYFAEIIPEKPAVQILPEIDASVNALLEDHFSQAHTDMIGDEEERRGYRKGIAALANALKAKFHKPF